MPDVSGAPDGPTGHLFEARYAVRATGLRRTSARFAHLRGFALAFGNPVTRLPEPLRGRGRGASPPTEGRSLGLPHRLRPGGLVAVFAALAAIAFADRCPSAAPPCLALKSARGCGLDALAPPSAAPTSAPVSQLISSTRNEQCGLFDRTVHFVPRSRGCCAFTDLDSLSRSCGSTELRHFSQPE